MSTQTTAGQFFDEKAAAHAFDQFVEGAGCFKVYKEVIGKYLFTPPEKDSGAPRIDRILCFRGTDAPCGAIGVELKRSGMKIGPPLSQCLDYRRAAFQLNNGNPVWVLPDYVFLFPCDKTENEAGSFTAQNHIGTVRHDRWDGGSFAFFSGNQLVFRVFSNGEIVNGKVKSGSRQGSR